MSNAPERIWAWQTSGWGALQRGQWQNTEVGHKAIECTAYVRADVFDALARDASRAAELEAFVGDFAAAKFKRMDRRAADPQNDLDPLTDYLTVEAWQDDARALLKGGGA